MTPGYFLGGLDHAVAQPVVPAQVSDPTTQVIDADMIASGRVTKAANLTDAHGVGKGLISGHVYLTGPNGNPGAAYDNGNIKLDDITVYAQFRDKDGSYSPIFSAKTHTLPDVLGGNGGQGTFAFGTGDKGITWTDKLGRKHTWAARTDQKHRIWVEPFINDRGSRVEMFRQANGWTPGSFNGVVEGPMGSFVAADGNMQLMAAFLREIPPSHETSWMAAKGDKLVEDPKGPDKAAALQGPESNMLSGQVWLETGGSPDWGFPATGPKKESKDPGAAGYTVFASTLTREGAAANAALHAQYKDDPNKLAEATKKMLEDNPEYILKTVYGKTDAEGNYSLRFGDYTDANQTREDFLNPDHVFVWVENKDGVVQTGYTGFHTPIFQRFNGGGNFRPADAVPAENQVKTALVSDIGNPRYGKPLNKIYNVRHALIPYAPVTITADYNATDKPAAPGTTVTPEFHGTLSPLPSKIEWRDGKGKVVKTCDLDQSKGTKAQVSACTFDIPKDAKKGDVFSVVVVSGISDVAAWTVLVTKDADDYEPEYEGKLVVPGQETKSSPSFTDKDGKGVDVPEGSKFAITDGFTAPEGYEVSIDENTGEITVTFPDGSKLNKDTVEEFDVPVTVTYPDGTTDKTDANFKLDTDGDGTPDAEDEDDDNDGVPDEKEKEDDTNPKSPNQNTIFEPEYEGKLVVPGQETKSSPSFTDKDGKGVDVPEGSKFSIGDYKAPEGYVVTIDENTGEITVTFPDGSKLNKDTTEEFDVPVTVTYKDGSTDEVKANFKLDTDGDGDPDVTDPDDDGDGIPDEDDSNPKVPNQNTIFEPGYEDGSGKPGEDVTIPAPEFKDKDGKATTPPEGTKFTPGENVPDGVTIDENTGEIKVTIPEDATPGDKITVPVVVTYPDGTKDNVDVTVTVEQPDQPDAKDNEKFEPAYEGKLVVPGQETKSSPSFTDKDGKGVDVPEGSKFSIGDYKAPEGYVVTIDENTGEITVTFPDGSKLNKDTTEEFDVPVTVTYKDGSTDEVKANFKLDTDGDGDPDVTDPDDDGDGIPDEDDSNPKVPNQNTIFEPGYEDGSGKPGEDVTIPAPEFKDKDGKATTPPEGTKFTPGENVPDGVTIDENTGEIKVTIPEDATPGDKITVPVVVTYPDGTKDNVDVTVTVEQPDQPEVKDNEKYEPEYNGGSGEPGTDVTVDKPVFKDGDGNEVTPPEGTKFTPGEDTPDGVTIDENTGEIKVTIPEDAKPGDKIEVPVVVTYPDGSTDEVTVTITVTEKDATPVTPGEPTEHNPSLGASADDPADCEMPPFVTVEKTEGVVYKVTVDGKELTPDAEGKYVYDYGQTVKVEATPAEGYTFPEGTQTTWTYTTEQNEVCNVPDTPETKDNENFEPEYEDGTGKPGDDVTVDKPTFKDGDGNEVTPPEGTTFTPGEGTPDGVTVNEDGSIKVTIPEDATPGDKITVPVVVTYPDGSKDNVDVTVTVGEPDTKTPDWKDGSGEPGGKVVIPNDGGPVDDGTTVETDGPGKAEIDGDGNLVVDIDDNAKPGDKIVVIVKDKDGNEIDRVTVTVEKPAADDNTGETTEKVVQKPKLARTGVQVAGLAGIAAAMGVAGLGLAFVRRRREGEEN
ncbi:YPDG domain-containing protein [Gleimia europaea]|uniref:YPDG domain-containing protein n=2 Tax=Actinomycetaceae TaxID=2049 RepID=UPI0026585451|nr:YPDG domain-containing protein [Gleimia europaea]MDK7142978.1 YPDG domain-containing protein [Gleimia europaea]